MKKISLLAAVMMMTFSCGPHRYGIITEANPKEHVHVFLHPHVIISGIKLKNGLKTIDEVNNEKSNFDFFILPDEQEIYLRTAYTKGVYAYRSQSIPVTIKADKGDLVFICADIKEIGSKPATGGNVTVLLKPEIIYLKTEEEKLKALNKDTLNADYFYDRCLTAIYGKP